MAKLALINRRLLVRKGTTGVKEVTKDGTFYNIGGIVVTQKRGEFQHWWEILDVADDCKLFDKSMIGSWIRLPEWDADNCDAIIPCKLWVVNERIFEQGRAPACIVTI